MQVPGKYTVHHFPILTGITDT